MLKAWKCAYNSACVYQAQCLLFLRSCKVLQNRYMTNYSTNQNICVVPLNHRSLLQVSGKDSLEFLQGLVTNDVEQLANTKCMYAFMLNKKGRVMHDIILYKSSTENAILLECQSQSVEALIKTLKLYKLRKKVEIRVLENLYVWQALVNQQTHYPGDESIKAIKEMLSSDLFQDTTEPLFKDNVVAISPDPRLSWLGWRVISNSTQPCSEEYIESEDVYHIARYFYGIPEGPVDLLPGKSLPIESNGDYMNGISFNKGCYLGQELTARSHFTGMTRKRLMPIIMEYSKKTIQPETKLFDAKGNISGKYRSSYDEKFGLGLISLDRQNVRLVTPTGIHVKINKTYWWPDAKK